MKLPDHLEGLFDKSPPDELIQLMEYHRRTIMFLDVIAVQLPRGGKLRNAIEDSKVVACLELNKTLEGHGLICGYTQWAVKRLDCLTENEKHYLRKGDYKPYLNKEMPYGNKYIK